jgi:hypothetical protein
MGDPYYGHAKTCSYTTTNVLQVPDDSLFNIQSPQNTPQNVIDGNVNNLIWARYGVGEKWTYTLVNTNTELVCDLQFYGMDPAPGQDKFCQYAPAIAFATQTAPRECAAQNGVCSDVGYGAILASFVGVAPVKTQNINSGQANRIVSTSTGNFTCNAPFFGPDPAIGTLKTCYYQVIGAAAAVTTGEWYEVDSCDGSGCALSQNLTISTTKTDSTTSTSSWSETVTISMSAGFDIEGEQEKVTGSSATQFAGSSAFTSALAATKSISTSVTCQNTNSPETPQTSLTMYQFGTKTDATCVMDPSCSGTTQTSSHACVSNAPPGYTGPACAPGFFDKSDPLFKTCVQ